MAQLPLVSVLVPTYNGEQFLEETLRSIRCQSHRQLEVIIRDDGSTDSTVEIANKFVAADPRFRIVADRANGGGFANYIELAKLARGQFIKYCNQDDVLDSRCIRTLLRPMMANPRILLATSSRRLIDADGAELPPRAYTAALLEEDGVAVGRSVSRHVLLSMMNKIGEPSTTLYRSRSVRPDSMFDFGGHTFRVNCDLALWLSLLSRGELYYHVEPLSSFRIHGAQFSANTTAILNGALEWVHFMELGLASGILEPGGALIDTGERLMSLLATHLNGVVGSADPTLEAYVGPLTHAIDTVLEMSTCTEYTGRDLRRPSVA